jgi:hypothetical protein
MKIILGASLLAVTAAIMAGCQGGESADSSKFP